MAVIRLTEVGGAPGAERPDEVFIVGKVANQGSVTGGGQEPGDIREIRANPSGSEKMLHKTSDEVKGSKL